MEDHAEALRAKGCSEEEARERATGAMGGRRRWDGSSTGSCPRFGCGWGGCAVPWGSFCWGWRCPWDSAARWFRESVQKDPTNLARQYTNRDPAWPAADLLGEAELASQWGNKGEDGQGRPFQVETGREGRETGRWSWGAEAHQGVARPRLTDALKALWFRL